MTKDDVTALYIHKVLLTRCCYLCSTHGDSYMDEPCNGCLVKDAWPHIYWLQRQRQQTARERRDALDT